MRFGHIELFVTDPLRSKEFYQDVLGFEVTLQDDQLVWLKKGALEILLRPGNPPPSGPNYEHARLGLVLYTTDVEEMLAELQDRGLVFKGTVDSDKCHTFTDLDGNWFQLVNPNDH